MRIITVMTAMIFVLATSSAIAGENSRFLYGYRFDDSDVSRGMVLRAKAKITLTCQHQRVAKIRYYTYDGSLFPNTSDFIHVIRGGAVSWRPNDDLRLEPGSLVQGSFIIEIEDADAHEISGTLTQEFYAGEKLPDSNPDEYLNTSSIPLLSHGSNYFWVYVMAWHSNKPDTKKVDYSLQFFLTNPYEDTEEGTIHFYDRDGKFYDRQNYRLAPHETINLDCPVGNYGNIGLEVKIKQDNPDRNGDLVAMGVTTARAEKNDGSIMHRVTLERLENEEEHRKK